jgi:DNA-binding transcriptional LysR family regulator
MKLDLDDAALFLRVAELGTLSAAARERNLPVSQISRTLVRLETRCGARLMHRTTHGLSLTDEGDTFAEHARRLVDARDELAAAFRHKTSGPSGWVRLSVSSVLAETLIAPSLPSLYEAHPGLQIELLADDRMSDLARDGIDLAIRTGALTLDNLVARQIGDHGRRLCASPAYVERFGVPTHPDQLPAHRIITSSSSPTVNRWPWAKREDAPSKGVYFAQGHTRTDNSALMMTLAVQGVGIARLNDLLTREHMAAGRLVPVLDDWFERSRVPIYAVMLSERHRLPKVRACIDHWARWVSGEAQAALPPGA